MMAISTKNINVVCTFSDNHSTFLSWVTHLSTLPCIETFIQQARTPS